MNLRLGDTLENQELVLIILLGLEFRKWEMWGQALVVFLKGLNDSKMKSKWINTELRNFSKVTQWMWVQDQYPLGLHLNDTTGIDGADLTYF